MARSLDLNKLKNSKSQVKMSTEESLKDVTPFKWPKEVLDGAKRVEITDITSRDDGKAGVKIKYV